MVAKVTQIPSPAGLVLNRTTQAAAFNPHIFLLYILKSQPRMGLFGMVLWPMGDTELNAYKLPLGTN